MARERTDALAVVEDVDLIANFKRIAELAVKQRLPSISFIEYANAGGLFGYGVNFLALYRRAPVFVDRILKGARPADIPIERPTTFNLVINMGTAKLPWPHDPTVVVVARRRGDPVIERSMLLASQATGSRFVFNQNVFDVICSGLNAVPLSRAASASSAVPVVLSAVTLNNYGGTCNMKRPEETEVAEGVVAGPLCAKRQWAQRQAVA